MEKKAKTRFAKNQSKYRAGIKAELAEIKTAIAQLHDLVLTSVSTSPRLPEQHDHSPEDKE